MAPWSNSPNMTLKEYGRQLDKRQRAAKNQGVTIYKEDKTTHFVGCAKDSGLFKEEWVTEWEATSKRTWTVVRNVLVGKWLKVTRAATMAAKRGGYKSAAALRETRETPALNPAPSKVTRAEYNTILEYACALEAENAELKSGGGDDMTTISNVEAASVATETATNNTTGILAKLRAVHAAQMQEMAAATSAVIFCICAACTARISASSPVVLLVAVSVAAEAASRGMIVIMLSPPP